MHHPVYARRTREQVLQEHNLRWYLERRRLERPVLLDEERWWQQHPIVPIASHAMVGVRNGQEYEPVSWEKEPEQLDYDAQAFHQWERWDLLNTALNHLTTGEPESERNLRQEQQLSSTFSEIERLSSWVPSAANKAKLGRALRTAKERLDDLRDDEKRHVYLREFMARHHTIAELFKELHQLTHKLRNHALKKAAGYEKLYDDFIAYREGLSDLLDLASAGQGRSFIDSFTSSLKNVAISARREADLWERQGNKFSDWTNIQETYSSASAKMPAFPPDPGEASSNDTSLTETVPPDRPNPLVLVQTTQQVSKSFSHLHTYVAQTQSKFIQKRLVKTSHSLTKGFTKTKAYLDLVKNTAGEEVSRVMVRLVNTVLDVSKVWKKIHFSVKCWSPVWALLLKPSRTLPSVTVNTQKSSLREGNSSDRYDLLMASIDAASKRLHPLLIDYHASLLSMSNGLFSQADFWADAEKRLDHILQETQPIGNAL